MKQMVMARAEIITKIKAKQKVMVEEARKELRVLAMAVIVKSEGELR